MMRLLIALAFWALYVPVAALLGFPVLFATGKIDFLYRLGMWGALTGVRVAGVRVALRGLEHLDPARNYIFMSNHTSNLDPPILIPMIPGRTSVLAKKVLFRIPLFGHAMRRGRLIPVDRSNREAAVRSMKQAVDVLRDGLHMTVYPEGTRSRDGRLLPFKKGPFYLAMEAGVPVVPVTMVNTYELWPKGRLALRKGTAEVVFHPPIDPKKFDTREALMRAVRQAIEGALPLEYRDPAAVASEMGPATV